MSLTLENNLINSGLAVQLEEASGKHKTWKTTFTSFVYPRFHFSLSQIHHFKMLQLFLWKDKEKECTLKPMTPLSGEQIRRVALDKMYKTQYFIKKKKRRK